MTTQEFEFIIDTSRLEEVVKACRQKTAVSIDTEFARFNTYYPIVGLIQLYDGEFCYLIDPLEVEDLSSLADLLGDSSVVKIFHACSEDMEVFQHCLGALPVPVYDSQIAAALLGRGFSLSYQNLVENYLSILVPKGETRSDWLQRPLTNSQLQYAALDVTYLLEVYELQQEELKASGKLEWAKHECSQLATDIPTQINPDDYYHKVKNTWRLNRRQLTLLKVMCAWREKMARELNIPRNRVVEEKSLVLIAQLSLTEKQQFRDKANLHPSQLRKHAEALMTLVESVQSLDEDQLVEQSGKPAAPVNSKSLKALKLVVEEKAREYKVAPEMLAKRRHLEKLLRSEDASGNYSLPASLKGWREAVIGDALLRSLSD